MPLTKCHMTAFKIKLLHNHEGLEAQSLFTMIQSEVGWLSVGVFVCLCVSVCVCVVCLHAPKHRSHLSPLSRSLLMCISWARHVCCTWLSQISPSNSKTLGSDTTTWSEHPQSGGRATCKKLCLFDPRHDRSTVVFWQQGAANNTQSFSVTKIQFQLKLYMRSCLSCGIFLCN